MKQKIAITGGIGSGKSLVGKILREEGFTVYSCDDINKEVLISPEYVEQVEREFPSCIQGGKINRKLLAAIVFNDSRKLDKLNRIAHPRIMQKLNNYMEEDKASIVFAEVPLLFECGYESAFDKILVVQRTRKARVSAVAARDSLNEEEILSRIDTQFPYDTQEGEKYIKKINAYQIFNNGTIDNLKAQISAFLNTLK